MRLAIIILLLGTLQTSIAQRKFDHQLKSLIIRSADIENGKGILGIKGEKPGEGCVYIKEKKSDRWIICNNGKPLADSVEDVQSVEIISELVMLAGTWKQGLFRSTDNGKSWSKVTGMPAKDIRSIKKSPSQPSHIYAATVSHGIMLSTDQGLTWTQTCDAADAKLLPSWSITIDPKDHETIYAMTFQNGIMKSGDGGKTWKEALKTEGVMYMSLDIEDKEMWACGSGETKNALAFSLDKGTTWTQDTIELKSAYNSLKICKKGIVLGSWNHGLIAYSPKNDFDQDIGKVESKAIAHISEYKKQLYIFTWGNGVYR